MYHVSSIPTYVCLEELIYSFALIVYTRIVDLFLFGRTEYYISADIVCVWGGVRYIIDITIAWSTDTGGVFLAPRWI